MALILFLSYHQWRLKDNIFLLKMHNVRMTKNTFVKGFFDLWINFVWPQRLEILQHKILPALITLNLILNHRSCRQQSYVWHPMLPKTDGVIFWHQTCLQSYIGLVMLYCCQYWSQELKPLMLQEWTCTVVDHHIF